MEGLNNQVILTKEEESFKDNFENIYSDKEKEDFDRLSEVFKKDLIEDFEDDLENNSQAYFQEIKEILNELYDNAYEKDLGLVEGYSLEEHTSMVIHQFSKYYNQFNSKIQPLMDSKEFIQMLVMHDIGKVSESVQDLKKDGVEKKIWKKEEVVQTEKIISDILSHMNASENKSKLILSLVGEASGKIGAFVNGYVSAEDMREYIEKESQKLKIDNPKNFFDILEAYFICDASSYTIEALNDNNKDLFNNSDNLVDKGSQDKKEIYQLILKGYENGIRVKKGGDGNGVTSWFHQGEDGIWFTGYSSNEEMRERIDELRKLL